MDLAQLEADLLARWGREELTVYADYLQSIGDPRGEVIAIDLVNFDTVAEAAWREQRHTVMTAWLGAELADKIGPSIFQGFVQETTGEPIVLDSPAGEFVRAFRSGDRGAIERIVRRPRPWLARIAIQSDTTTMLIPDALCDRLVAATPRLDEVVVRGRNVFGQFSHPHVRHVLIDGPAVTALCWRGEWLSPPPAFEIERVREPSQAADSRLHLRLSSGMHAVLGEPAIKNHVTHLRIQKPQPGQTYAGADMYLIRRCVDELPRLGVLEGFFDHRKLEGLRNVIPSRVAIVALDR